MGNLARDPEVRYTVDKRAWVRFIVAVGSSWKDKNGELHEETDFVPVTAWGPKAESCGRYLKKGSAVLVEGKIKVRSYEAKDGSGKKYATEVAAYDVLFISSKRSSEDDEPGGGRSSFAEDADFGKSMREKGFGDDFPMDFAGIGEPEGGESDAEIPF